MKPDLTLLLAGFGGQGLLFAGKVTAYAGLLEGREISWLPSYGPEMRGGTCNCSVTVSDEPIGSPLILNPNALIVMNLPSFDKFIGAPVPGAAVMVDSSMIDKRTDRTDIDVHYVPATKLAQDNDIEGLANMILLGKLMAVTGFTTMERMSEALKKCVSAKRPELYDKNMLAVRLGVEYREN
ncbi:MAG: 2-oxoacid:acceptor oxidoreductase family protein [Oscillospiraceae bacterium]|jgi:2-oxoglutarate ferredoxin oxidoreductase subunit gamma|nr:2-oxoacid:acceptor oxidoreductase family protein [Oscillospiraceae bacterium]